MSEQQIEKQNHENVQNHNNTHDKLQHEAHNLMNSESWSNVMQHVQGMAGGAGKPEFPPLHINGCTGCRPSEPFSKDLEKFSTTPAPGEKLTLNPLAPINPLAPPEVVKLLPPLPHKTPNTEVPVQDKARK